MRRFMRFPRPVLGALLVGLLPLAAQAQERAMSLDTTRRDASGAAVQPHRGASVAPTRAATTAQQRAMAAFTARVGGGAKVKGRAVVGGEASSARPAAPTATPRAASSWRLGSPQPVLPRVRAKGAPSGPAPATAASRPGAPSRD